MAKRKKALRGYLGLKMPFKADYMDGDSELEKLDSIGIEDGEQVFFNKDKSRWFDVDTVVEYFKYKKLDKKIKPKKFRR